MKKLNRKYRIIVLVVMSIMLLAGCSKQSKEPINIATLNGPTGLGMVKLMEEDNTLYNITSYQAPDEIVGKVISGEVDIACVPSNLAATLYNKTEGGIQLVGTNTLGVLYMIEKGDTVNSIQELKGKTILASGKGSTPEFILNTLLTAYGMDAEKDVTVEYMANHSDVVSALLADESGKVALVAEPHVTTALSKEQSVRIAIDMNNKWKNTQDVDLPMGVVIVSKAFASDRKKELNTFISEYKASVEFVNTQVDSAAKLAAEYNIVPSEDIAKQAIPKCNIVFIDAQTAQPALEKFYQIISEIEPKSVGGKLPDEAFYFKP